MNYLSVKSNKTEEEFCKNLFEKKDLFPKQLIDLILYKDFNGVDISAFGSINFKLDFNENGIQIQVPHSVEYNMASISELFLFNLDLSLQAKMSPIIYLHGQPERIDSKELINLLEDKTKFYLRNICWDVLENGKIQFHLNIVLDKKENHFLEISFEFFEKDILSAKLRLPNYTEQEYVNLINIGNNNQSGINRNKEILNMLNSVCTNKEYVLI